MRRLQFGILGSTLAALALCVLLAGCSKDKDKDEGELTSPTKTKGDGTKKKAGGTQKLVEGKGTATLKGKITVKGGSVPAGVLEELTKNFQDLIAKKADDKSVCMAGSPAEITEQIYRLGANKNVGNVVVWLMPPDRNTFFKIDEKQAAEAKAHPVEIDQPHCAFLPHVSTVFVSYRDPANLKNTVETGQTLTVKNSAKIGHNTNWSGGPDEPKGNQLIAPGGSVKIADLMPDAKAPLTIKCNIHGWMDGYVWIFDHPYATVSRSDTAPKGLDVKHDDPTFGTYEIKGAPAGAKLRLVAWHEKAGFLTGRDGEEIELKEGDNTKDFELEVKP